MAWVIGLGAASFLFYRFRVFRQTALVLVSLLIVLGVGFWLYQQRQEQISRSLIPHEQLEFSDMSLFTQSGTYKISGEIRNNSAHELSAVTLILQAFDCPEDRISPKCVVIGEDDVYVFITIPPHQLRAFHDEYVSFRDMATAKGKFVWTYLVKETSGRDA